MKHSAAYICFIVLFSVCLRCMISLYPHSGQSKPPMYGDYEAQRHWMEITLHLPVKQWYVNGTNNDLQFWGLDYPPLTAYHSWLLGALSHRINSSWVELNKSHGVESYNHKLFMRLSVLSSDALLFIPFVVWYYLQQSSQLKGFKSHSMISCLLTLIYPGIMLIDHGHFQYNCVSLGLTLVAIIALSKGKDVLGSAAFTLALNYKQMSLYYAVPFFTYLLGTCLFAPSRLKGFLKLVSLGLVVIATFVLCWLPFIFPPNTLLQVVHRLFPFARGLFEDKVANVWCSLSVIFKFKRMFEQLMLIRLSFVATLLAILPSALHLLVRPTITNFKYGLINASLGFFLFSFQVHEKSILLPALPVSIMLSSHPLLCVWFLMVSTFSMLPLLLKDGLFGAYLGSMVVFYVVAHIGFKETASMSNRAVDCWTASNYSERHSAARKLTMLFGLSCAGMVAITVYILTVGAPRSLPDLHAVFVCCYSCLHFVAFFGLFHWLQFTSSEPSKSYTAIKKKNK